VLFGACFDRSAAIRFGARGADAAGSACIFRFTRLGRGLFVIASATHN
jgi:hypothetical protein